MPYRIDLPGAPLSAFDRLVDLGALDVEPLRDGLAAVMPDTCPARTVAAALGVESFVTGPAHGQDDGSVWLVQPRPVSVRRWRIIPELATAAPDASVTTAPASRDTSPPTVRAVRLQDGHAFGSGWHATTALCLEALDDLLSQRIPANVLDVGTGSGVLALAALAAGVAVGLGVDIDAAALAVASANARINGAADRLALVHGDLEAVPQRDGPWALVLANVLAAPLIDMAPRLVRRLGHDGRIVLSGFPEAMALDVERSYQRAGLRPIERRVRGGWSAVVLATSW